MGLFAVVRLFVLFLMVGGLIMPFGRFFGIGFLWGLPFFAGPRDFLIGPRLDMGSEEVDLLGLSEIIFFAGFTPLLGVFSLDIICPMLLTFSLILF